MRIFDPHIHMTSRTTDDYERMHAAGVRALVEPAFWLGQPRTSVGSFTDYFDALVGWERFRAAQFGIAHHCTIALNPKEANDPRCVEVLHRQLELAVEFELPAMVHTPHRDKEGGTRRTLELVEESGLAPGMVVVDHLNELTVGPVETSGCWMGFSIYPDTKMDPQRMVRILQDHGPDRVLINSAADWGRSDPLLTRATGEAMLAAGFTDDDVDRVLWRNPVEFFAQSGRLMLDEVAPEADDTATFEGNSILRGARVS
jgi:predicted metal-dependent TIM-barrel fold hydrolase